jgi:hypothetical protein
MDYGILAFVVIVGVVLYFLLWAKPAAVFVIEVSNGAALTKEGKVTEAFLDEITEQCVAAQVLKGELRGVPRGPRISLEFSPEFPADLQQRLRNWWGMNGWLATPRRAKPGSE